jgi:hypothetical protein
VAEAARLESVFRVKSNGGSNPPSSANTGFLEYSREPIFLPKCLISNGFMAHE